MPNNVNEYVFCPMCGSITTPGICTQCGYNLEQKEEETNRNVYSAPETNTESVNQNDNQNYNRDYSQNANLNYGQGYNQNYNQNYDQSYNGYYNQNNDLNYNPNTNQNLNNNLYGTQPQQNLYQSVPMEPEKKKSRWWIWLLIIAGVLFLGAFLVVVVIIALVVFVPILSVTNTGGMNQGVSSQISPVPQVEVSEVLEEDSEAYYEEDSITENGSGSFEAGSSSYAVYAADHTRYDLSEFDWSAYANSADLYSDTTDGTDDFYLEENFASTFGTNHDNHFGEAFLGDYFEPFVECIDENQDYGLERHFISYADEKDGVGIYGSIAYMQFTGGTIPNEEALNQQILNATANDLFAYLDGKKTYDVMGSLHFFVDSFVVYNDAEKVSILLDINVVGDESTYADSYVYAINIATKSGVILDNSEFISVDEAFAAEFRERCCTQNGTDIPGLNSITDEELAKLLGDEKTNIVFFSPYGLEFGYNYEMGSPEGYSRGWMTITMKDWADYTESLGEIISIPAEESGMSQMGGTTDL